MPIALTAAAVNCCVAVHWSWSTTGDRFGLASMSSPAARSCSGCWIAGAPSIDVVGSRANSSSNDNPDARVNLLGDRMRPIAITSFSSGDAPAGSTAAASVNASDALV
jgi:hypothetical protein